MVRFLECRTDVKFVMSALGSHRQDLNLRRPEDPVIPRDTSRVRRSTQERDQTREDVLQTCGSNITTHTTPGILHHSKHNLYLRL